MNYHYMIAGLIAGFLFNSIYRNVKARHRYNTARKHAIENLKSSVLEDKDYGPNGS